MEKSTNQQTEKTPQEATEYNHIRTDEAKSTYGAENGRELKRQHESKSEWKTDEIRTNDRRIRAIRKCLANVRPITSQQKITALLLSLRDLQIAQRKLISAAKMNNLETS